MERGAENVGDHVEMKVLGGADATRCEDDGGHEDTDACIIK